MSRQNKYTLVIRCGHPACKETFTIGCKTAKEHNDRWYRYKNWRCTEHQHPEKSLTPSNPKIVHELELDSNSKVYGEGWMVNARNIPKGSVVRVTAEIIIPKE